MDKIYTSHKSCTEFFFERWTFAHMCEQIIQISNKTYCVPTLASSCRTEANWVFHAIEKPWRASLMGSVCRQIGPTGNTGGIPRTFFSMYRNLENKMRWCRLNIYHCNRYVWNRKCCYRIYIIYSYIYMYIHRYKNIVQCLMLIKWFWVELSWE